MNEWYSSVFKGFMFASIISFIISLFTSGKTSYGAELSGYSTIILAIFLILLIMFQNKSIVSSSCFILLLAVIGFIMYSVIKYKDNIIDGHVAPYLKTFTTISILLIMIQTYVMYSSIFNEKFDKTHTISKVNTYLLYLLSIITFVCSLIIFVILRYYTTDG
jgi:NAD/NADP transhydrogenase beta subunit